MITLSSLSSKALAEPNPRYNVEISFQGMEPARGRWKGSKEQTKDLQSW